MRNLLAIAKFLLIDNCALGVCSSWYFYFPVCQLLVVDWFAWWGKDCIYKQAANQQCQSLNNYELHWWITVSLWCLTARYRQQNDQAQAYYRHAARLVPYNGTSALLHYSVSVRMSYASFTLPSVTLYLSLFFKYCSWIVIFMECCNCLAIFIIAFY